MAQRSGVAAMLLQIVLVVVAGPWASGATNLCTPEQFTRFPSGWPTKLDTSLYWIGKGDEPSQAVNSEKSKFYDPSRRTVIFFHGWTGSEGGSTQTCHRQTTQCPQGVCAGSGVPESQLLMDAWIDQGWNVGFFYWDQFSDEECARDAEQKIWFDRKGDGLTWKSYDVDSGVTTRKNYLGGVMSVADICMNTFWKVLAGHQRGSEVRFVGHSIGAQLAVRCAAMLHHQNHPAAPQRLALLEPYFTKHHLWLFRCVGKTDFSTDEGVGNFAPIATAGYAKHLYDTQGVITEVYKSSVFTEMSGFGNTNADLQKFSTFVQYEPRWCGGMGVLAKMDVRHTSCRHYSAIALYFLSYAEKPPPLVAPLSTAKMHPTSAMATCPTPAASCKYGELQQWVERQINLAGHYQSWKQKLGGDTLDIHDDTFDLTPRDDSTNEFVLAAVLEPQWKPKGEVKSPAAAAASLVLAHAPLILLGLFACVAAKLALGMVCHSSAPHEEDDEDSDESATERLMKASRGLSRQRGHAQKSFPVLAQASRKNDDVEFQRLPNA